jgi:PAS domain S-box-containing protein
MSKERNVKIFESMFMDATEGFIVSNQEGEIVLVNPKACKMFEYSEDEFLKLKIEDLIPKNVQTKHAHYRESYFANPSPRTMGVGRDLYAKKKNQEEFPVEISLSHVNSENQTLVVSFVIDISDRKKKDDELRKANEMLKKASFQLSKLNQDLEQKVQSRTLELAEMIKKLTDSKREVDLALEKEKELNDMKSRFISTASHEFRTPLATILSSVSLVGKYSEIGDTEKLDKHLVRIKESVNNLTSILNDFLSLDKLEEGFVKAEMENIDACELILDVIESIRGITKEGQFITFVNELNKKEIHTDRNIFRNLMINLLSNAIKYSNEGKEIIVKAYQKGSVFCLDVKDHGIGIPYEDQVNIFERFYRANNIGNEKGTGLGLNIVKKYIEILNGRITFESEPNKGSTFYIEIP